jgi:hypothetical protein
MATVARLEAILSADTSRFDRAMDKSESGLHKVAKAGALAAGAAGIGALTYTLHAGISEWIDSQKVMAQTRTVLKSTGHIANVTAGQVSDLATSIMKKTGIDDEAIASGENLLLTFKGIRNEVGKGNDVFTQATKITADLSVAFHKDLSSSAILVGKALNDPIAGLSALKRVGVSFTQSQKDQIKALEASGHHLQAQKLIMRELKSEVGGSAEAYGKTLPGMINIAKESFNNFAGDLIAKMIPVLQRVVGYLRKNWPEISAMFKHVWATDIKPPLDAMIGLIGSVVAVVRDNWSTIGPIVKTVGKIIEDTVKTMTSILEVFSALLRGDWSAAWDALKDAVGHAIDGIYDRLKLAGQVGGALAKAMGALAGVLVRALVDGLKGIGGKAWGVIANIGAVITEKANAILGWGSAIGSAVKNAVVSALVGVGSGAWDVLKNIGSVIAEHAQGITGWGASIVGLIKTGITDGAQAIKNAVENLFGRVIGWVKDVLGIGSPSKVFHEIGQNVIRGFVKGIGSMGGVLKSAVTGMVGDALGHLNPFAGGTTTKPGPKERGGGVHAEPQTAERFAMTMLPSFGWNSGQFSALRDLWMGESGWRWNADNPNSTAYGIPQALPGSKMASAGSDWHENAFTQIMWGLNYIKGRYGSPSRALQFWQSQSPHWYDKGGWLPPGLSLALNNTGQPERILPPGRSGGDIHIHLANNGVLGSRSEVIAWLREGAQQFQRRNNRPAFGAG